LADDGFGGMPARGVDVGWEVAADERFTRIEQRGMTTAAAEAAHNVRVELAGLRPGAVCLAAGRRRADRGILCGARSGAGAARHVSQMDCGRAAIDQYVSHR
jgi:phosphodiesterase/alkaline phosphatase D-like protein